jgi:ATP-dependent Clp protease protease subunit
MIRADGEQELADVAKTLNPMDAILTKNRTLTLFGEVNQDVSRRLSEKLLALAFESDDPITLYISWWAR